LFASKYGVVTKTVAPPARLIDINQTGGTAMSWKSALIAAAVLGFTVTGCKTMSGDPPPAPAPAAAEESATTESEEPAAAEEKPAAEQEEAEPASGEETKPALEETKKPDQPE